MNEPKRKPRKAALSIQYIVRTKDQVDEMKAAFDNFLKRCTIFDRGLASSGEIPVILSQDQETKSLSVNLDPVCEVAVHDFDSVVSVIYNIGEIKVTFKGGSHVKVRIGVMGPEDS